MHRRSVCQANDEPIKTFFHSGEVVEGERSLAVETPVQIVYGDIPFGVMMMSPADLEDFAYGFSLTEGVIAGVTDIRDITVEAPRHNGLRLRVDLVGARLGVHLARQRAMSGRTSCGLCGITDLDQLDRAQPASKPAPMVRLAALRAALQTLEDVQPLNARTRAVHGAAWCGLDGGILQVREDVGRHNALDKLVGALLRDGTDAASGFVLITSRASFEMVEKVAAFGARTLIAISAPTVLALDRARALDMTLVGIARRDAVTVFHGVERVVTR